MLFWLRVLATAGAFATLAPFARGAFPGGRHFVTARHGPRLALAALELALVAAWALALRAHHGERALLPPAFAPALFGMGALFALAGGALAGSARARLGRLFSPTFGVLESHQLVTDGPYAVTRHPIYTGGIAFVTGLGLAWNGLYTVALGLALAAPFALHTVVEEPLLSAHFGDAWRDYAARVPRLLPRPRER